MFSFAHGLCQLKRRLFPSLVALCLLIVSACGHNPIATNPLETEALEAETLVRSSKEVKKEAPAKTTEEQIAKTTEIAEEAISVSTDEKPLEPLVAEDYKPSGVIIEVLSDETLATDEGLANTEIPTGDGNNLLESDLVTSDTQIAFVNPELNEDEIGAESTTDIPATPVILEPLPVTDVWERIRKGFLFEENYPSTDPDINKRVEHYIRQIKRSPHVVNKVTDNARPYLYYVVEELEKHNVPLEIALLPIVESLYDPFAYSPGRASGLWQFIPGTGKRFGLTQNWWQDERRDTVSATGAAIQYLTYLHGRFNNDWLVALASYNAGQGNVSKAIRRNKKQNKPTDYWSLRLPKETRHYVPKLLAWREIIRDPESHGLTLQVIDNEPYFEFVDVGSQIDLAEAADLAGVDIDTLYQLNPAYNRWATDPETPHDLLVPAGKKWLLEDKLASIPVNERLTWKRYTIKSGDSLIRIARKFNTTPRLIAEVNNLKSNRIRAGKGLLIPSAARSEEYYSKSASQRLAKRQNRSPSSKKTSIKHTVASGETLWDIGKKYGVSSASIARWNGMAKGDVLSINQKLVIWQNTDSKQYVRVRNNEKRKLFYKVRSGDSLSRIAGKFNLRVADIKKWNSSARQKYLQPGQLLTLYVALTDRGR